MSEKGQGYEIGTGNEPIRVEPGLAVDETGNEVIVELRSEYILDSGGETVDSEAVGVAPPPTGQGTPGGRPD